MPPKGKPGTRGKKQIVEENRSTLKFYQCIILGINAIYVCVQYLFFWEYFTLLPIMLVIFASFIYFGSFRFMSSMATPVYSPDGALVDGGIDLNMESGMAEHCKDLILITAIVQALSLLSSLFWLLWLLAPGRAFYLLWVNILAPWIFAAPPEVDEKKMKKMERRMKRH